MTLQGHAARRARRHDDAEGRTRRRPRAGYGELRARATSVGPWEAFNASIGLRNVANWKFVSAELHYTGGRYGMLRARASTLGPWEEFTNPGPFPVA